MTVQNSFVIRAGDYGHELDFFLIDRDGKPYPIPAEPTITLEARLDGAAVLFLSDNTHVSVINADGGKARYTVQSGDWDTGDEGLYWLRLVVNTITCAEVPLSVLADEQMPQS